ncbi:hypothetical protein RCL1_002506 [Eukaryota sp. TZLM3-RCL]
MYTYILLVFCTLYCVKCSNDELFQVGRSKFLELKQQSYSSTCLLSLFETLPDACSNTEDVRDRTAAHWAVCQFAKTGLTIPPCSSSEPFITCSQRNSELSKDWFSLYNLLYANTLQICYFLQTDLLQKQTMESINVLYSSVLDSTNALQSFQDSFLTLQSKIDRSVEVTGSVLTLVDSGLVEIENRHLEILKNVEKSRKELINELAIKKDDLLTAIDDVAVSTKKSIVESSQNTLSELENVNILAQNLISQHQILSENFEFLRRDQILAQKSIGLILKETQELTQGLGYIGSKINQIQQSIKFLTSLNISMSSNISVLSNLIGYFFIILLVFIVSSVVRTPNFLQKFLFFAVLASFFVERIFVLIFKNSNNSSENLSFLRKFLFFLCMFIWVFGIFWAKISSIFCSSDSPTVVSQNFDLKFNNQFSKSLHYRLRPRKFY